MNAKLAIPFIILLLILAFPAGALADSGAEVSASATSNGPWTTYTTADGLVANKINAIAVDAAGRAWFGTDQGVSVFDGNTWTTYDIFDNLVNNYVNDIAVEEDGDVWIATPGGVSMFNGTTFTNYTAIDGLVSNNVTAVAVDNVRDLWFGTDSGVSKLSSGAWTTYTTADGLASNSINDVAVDNAGNIWFATFGGISRFNGTSWVSYKQPADLPGNTVYCLAANRNNNDVWASLATHSINFRVGNDVSRFSGGVWATYTDPVLAFVGTRVPTVAYDGFQGVWFGTEGDWVMQSGQEAGKGVVHFHDGTWLNYTQADGLASNNVFAIVVEPDGDVWFGTDNGATRLAFERLFVPLALAQ